ncbi:putative 3-hydroxyacyl-CoA dehyrogenase [Aspergillus bombycis]|uniref:Putative 3-hydroxyacyl-CoA dehyrogenase n=1 Tax=Aspergillus bombycis TaxID=109264 RepID=A0A1F8A4I5_9EURO|nr:putative 3-hydroxyacyl-CoA dehyrogenase [Aspergillus bombycis]OGM46319.1 putative 3-hydroxyacyl-CoA dehyrogenase [Aspergillus bombycis]
MHQPSSRPVVVLGAGVLGRRIASVFLAGGYNVHIRDPSPKALSDASSYIDSHLQDFRALTPSQRTAGTYKTFTEIPAAVSDAWLVVEAVPEKLPLKISTFAEVDRNAPADCIIASNSSSFKSRLMLDEVKPERRERVLNMHFTMPPAIRTVELMTDGETSEKLFTLLTVVLKECGMVPVTARRESTGFIFNRLWAAIKREIMLILAEDVSSPEEIDLLWENMFQLPSSLPPCRLMDQIGLDTVALIEDNYIQERGIDGRSTVDWLREKYISPGRLGLKSDKGGLYPPTPEENGIAKDEEALYLLDVGLGSNNPDISLVPTAGRILKYHPGTGKTTTIIEGQSLPDGIDVSRTASRIFWTNMGRSTATHDGSVHSANLDGTDVRTLLPSGTVHTPKQLVLDDINNKVYFCDREGMGVHRVNFDGTEHEVLVRTGSLDKPEERKDMTRWCVGITLDMDRGYIYWTQKGPSKSGQGRIFRAGVDIPAGQTVDRRQDIELLLEGLPEPIDLELDVENQLLYWTDRGEHPTGCSLNRVEVRGKADKRKLQSEKEILARQFHEPIGIKLDGKKQVYVTDLGGSVYRVSGGKKTVMFRDNSCYTGIAIL